MRLRYNSSIIYITCFLGRLSIIKSTMTTEEYKQTLRGESEGVYGSDSDDVELEDDLGEEDSFPDSLEFEDDNDEFN